MNVGGIKNGTSVSPGSLIRAALVCAAAILLAAGTDVSAQSNDQAFPTPITTNEISGTIPARDLGDPRLTTYYYAFEGKRGDVFINIYTTNFNGAIDIFTRQGLDPRTKITIYSDNPERETGRVIYQRRDEKLILRIQGRTPNDDPATFRLKFAGSFSPLAAVAGAPGEMPSVSDTEGVVPVNAAGGIVPEEPGNAERRAERRDSGARPERTGSEAEARPAEPLTPEPGKNVAEAASLKADEDRGKTDAEEKPAAKPEPKAPSKPVVVVTDELRPADDTAREVTVDITPRKDEDVSAVVTIERVTEETDAGKKADEETEGAAVEGNPSKAGAEPKAKELKEDGAPARKEADAPGKKAGDEKSGAAPANPLDRIFLRVELKDGTKIERRMSEVLSVNVMNGTLVIVTNDGRREISILDVAKMVIE